MNKISTTGKKINYKTKLAATSNNGFSNGISRGCERKSTTGRFVIGRFWPCT